MTSQGAQGVFLWLYAEQTCSNLKTTEPL